MINKKTLSMKILEEHSIPYQVYTYPTNERDAVKIADYFEVERSQVFKTLVAIRSNRKPLLVMVPADYRLNLKKLAKVLGDKKLKMATHVDAERLTGLQVGGISALALLNKGFKILIDEIALYYDEIFISAGQKGVNLKVPCLELIQITAAQIVDVCEEVS